MGDVEHESQNLDITNSATVHKRGNYLQNIRRFESSCDMYYDGPTYA